MRHISPQIWALHCHPKDNSPVFWVLRIVPGDHQRLHVVHILLMLGHICCHYQILHCLQYFVPEKIWGSNSAVQFTVLDFWNLKVRFAWSKNKSKVAKNEIAVLVQPANLFRQFPLNFFELCSSREQIGCRPKIAFNVLSEINLSFIFATN